MEYAKEGVVVQFSRKLPSDVLKKPRNIRGYDTVMREREEELAPELPIEGAEPPSSSDDESGTGSGSGAAAATAASSSRRAKPAAPSVEKRHTNDFDRAAMMEKKRGVAPRIGVVLPIQAPPPSFSNKFSKGEKGVGEVRVPELEPDFGSEADPIGVGSSSELAVNMDVVKLGKSAILPSDELQKKTKTTAAIAIAEANEAPEFEEMRQPEPEIGSEREPEPAASDVAVAPKKRMIRPKAKGAVAAASAASGTVSAAASSVKAVVKKIKEREDSMVNVSAYKVGDTVVATRLPPPRPLPQVQASEFYMNNRAKFIQYINALFRPYREELTSGESDITCEELYGGDDSASVALLTHQKIVRD